MRSDGRHTMRFRMFFGWIKTTLILLVALAGAAIIVLDSLMVSGAVAALETANVTVAAVSLAAAALIEVFAVALLAFSCYTLKEDGIRALMAVFGDFVPYDDISRISVNAATGELFAAWRREGDRSETVTRFNLTEKDAKRMLAELQKRCIRATVDYFTPPEKTKKKD